MNPPFGPRNGIVPWLEKFFAHGNGIALVPDRTSAPWWQRFAPKAAVICTAQRARLPSVEVRRGRQLSRRCRCLQRAGSGLVVSSETTMGRAPRGGPCKHASRVAAFKVRRRGRDVRHE
jgi:hypothetical protein